MGIGRTCGSMGSRLENEWGLRVVGGEEEQGLLAGEFYYCFIGLFCCSIAGQIGREFSFI